RPPSYHALRDPDDSRPHSFLSTGPLDHPALSSPLGTGWAFRCNSQIIQKLTFNLIPMNTETHIATDALIALVAEAHASRRERLKPNEAPGYEGFIAEIRPTNFATDKEALLVKLVVPEC